MTTAPLRWGFLGTARISRKNWRAIRDSGNSIVAGVASRDIDRGRQFIAECQAEAPLESPPRLFGSYEELLADAQIDAVYIPLPTGRRKEWVLRAAAAGKHIVCEKPCAGSLADLEEMLAACREHRVQFMDGVMFQHSRRLGQMRAVLDDGQSVGPIRRVSSAFSFAGSEAFQREDIRIQPDLEPYGCLGDLGWYCLQFSLWALDWRMPEFAIGRILGPAGGASGRPLIRDFSGELLFDGVVSAGFSCSFCAADQQWATIGGPLGYLTVSDFVLPRSGPDAGYRAAGGAGGGFDVCLKGVLRPQSEAPGKADASGSQEARLFRDFAAQVRTGRLNTAWPEIAWKTQKVMAACYASALQESKPVSCR